MKKRLIELFVAGCPVCDDAVTLVRELACPSCDLHILDMKADPGAQKKATQYGIRRVPSVVIDGTIAPCCAGSGLDSPSLRAAGVGVPLG